MTKWRTYLEIVVKETYRKLLTVITLMIMTFVSHGQELRDTVLVLFPKESGRYDANYHNNGEKLDAFVERTRPLMTLDSNATYRIEAIGSASPEGEFIFNEILARRRHESVMQHLKNHYNFSPAVLESHYIPEDWDFLTELIRKDQNIRPSSKKEILSIIESAGKNEVYDDATIEKLLEVEYSRPYWYMYHNVFPYVRSCRIIFTVPLKNLVTEVKLDDIEEEEDNYVIEDIDFSNLPLDTLPTFSPIRKKHFLRKQRIAREDSKPETDKTVRKKTGKRGWGKIDAAVVTGEKAGKPVVEKPEKAAKPVVEKEPKVEKPTVEKAPKAEKPKKEKTPKAEKPAKAAKPAVEKTPKAEKPAKVAKPAVEKAPKAEKPAKPAVEKTPKAEKEPKVETAPKVEKVEEKKPIEIVEIVEEVKKEEKTEDVVPVEKAVEKQTTEKVVEKAEPVKPVEKIEKKAEVKVKEHVYNTIPLTLKANTIGYVLGVANIAAEIGITEHLSFSLPFYYSGIDYFKSTLKFRTCMLQPELRYNFAKVKGLYAGAHIGFGWYNVALDGEFRYQDAGGKRPAWGGGLGFGYRMPFKKSPNWGLEFAIGAGIYDAEYDIFYNEYNGPYYRTNVRKTWIGIDNASIAVTYRFDIKGRRAER